MHVGLVLQMNVPFVIETSGQRCRKVVGFQILSHSHLECRSEKLGGVVAKIRTPLQIIKRVIFGIKTSSHDFLSARNELLVRFRPLDRYTMFVPVFLHPITESEGGS